MNIVKELRKIAQLNAENALAQANSILDADSEKDMQMLQYFGRYSEVQKAESKKRDHEQIISGNFVTLNDVRKVCFKYALRYTNAEYYKKTIPAHALNDLRKFKEGNKGIYSDRLKVIAPVSHFHTVDKPKKDPVLVYEHSENRIEVISTWGNDFNVFRRLAGIWYMSWMFIVPIIIISFSIYLCTKINESTSSWYDVPVILSCIISAIASIIILISFCINNWPSGAEFGGIRRRWNSNYK